MPKHFAISLDNFVEEVHHHLSTHQDGVAGHYARYTAETKDAAVERAMQAMRPLLARVMYESDDYGEPAE